MRTNTESCTLEKSSNSSSATSLLGAGAGAGSEPAAEQERAVGAAAACRPPTLPPCLPPAASAPPPALLHPLGGLAQDGQHLAWVVRQPDGHHRHGVGNVQVVDLQAGAVSCGPGMRVRVRGRGGRVSVRPVAWRTQGAGPVAGRQAGSRPCRPLHSRRPAAAPRNSLLTMSRTRCLYTASPFSSVKVLSRRAKRRRISRCTGSCAIHSRMGPRASSRLISTSPWGLGWRVGTWAAERTGGGGSAARRAHKGGRARGRCLQAPQPALASPLTSSSSSMPACASSSRRRRRGRRSSSSSSSAAAGRAAGQGCEQGAHERGGSGAHCLRPCP